MASPHVVTQRVGQSTHSVSPSIACRQQRNHWGAPVGISVHDFAPDADAKADEAAWQDWLDGIYA